MKNIIAFLLCCFAAGIGVTTLVGYLVKDMRWASWVPDTVPMAISTAVAIVALSTAFMLHHAQRKGKCHDKG